MYWYKKLRFWIVPILVLIAAVLFFLFLAPTADSMLSQELQYTQNYDPVAYKSLESQVIKELYPQNSDILVATLVRKSGDFYDFAYNMKGEGGGAEVIAHMKSDGHFEKVWQGQDYPDCYSIIKYGVPVSIAPRCFEAVPLDRSNPVRAFFSLFTPIADIFR